MKACKPEHIYHDSISRILYSGILGTHACYAEYYYGYLHYSTTKLYQLSGSYYYYLYFMILWAKKLWLGIITLCKRLCTSMNQLRCIVQLMRIKVQGVI